MVATTAPPRVIRLYRAPDENGVGVFRITANGQPQFYTLREIRCDIGGRGFAVHRLGMGTLYHVRVGTPEECECECLGFLRWGRCKHILGLRALIRQGLL